MRAPTPPLPYPEPVLGLCRMIPFPHQPNPRDSAVWVPSKMGLCRDKNKERRELQNTDMAEGVGVGEEK